MADGRHVEKLIVAITQQGIIPLVYESLSKKLKHTLIRDHK